MPDKSAAEPIDKNRREELYAETRRDLLARQMSNSEKFDGAVLTLSTAALGFTLTFVKGIAMAGEKNVSHIFGNGFLIGLWVLFGTAIMATMSSFICSQLAIKKQLEYAEEYYLKDKPEYLNKRNTLARVTEILNYCAAGFFAVGMAGTVLFVGFHLYVRRPQMADVETDKPLIKGQPIPKMQPVESGRIGAEKARQTGGTLQADRTLKEPRPASDNNKKMD